jgi:hypothetical protein
MRYLLSFKDALLSLLSGNGKKKKATKKLRLKKPAVSKKQKN